MGKTKVKPCMGGAITMPQIFKKGTLGRELHAILRKHSGSVVRLTQGALTEGSIMRVVYIIV